MGSTKKKKSHPGTGNYDPVQCVWRPFWKKIKPFSICTFRIQCLFDKPILAMVVAVVVVMAGGVPVVSVIASHDICF